MMTASYISRILAAEPAIAISHRREKYLALLNRLVAD